MALFNSGLSSSGLWASSIVAVVVFFEKTFVAVVVCRDSKGK
jgi:hypothetical protein